MRSLNLRQLAHDSASNTLRYVFAGKEGKKIYLQWKCFPEILYSEGVVLPFCFHELSIIVIDTSIAICLCDASIYQLP